MTVNIAPSVRQQFVDANGNPLSGAKLFTYVAGTTTKQNTYTTSAGSVANSNPIVLDSSGRTPYGLWLDSALTYKFVFAPATDTDPPTSAYYTEDNITNDYSTAVASTVKVDGSSTITANIPFSGYKITGLGVGTTLGDALSYGNPIIAEVITCEGLYSSGLIGYPTGTGGTVTQLTSKTTGVTLNKLCGTITSHNASLNGDTTAAFTFTNSFISGSGDFILLNANNTNYKVSFSTVAAGSCQIGIRNITGGPLGDAIVINFLILNASTA